MCNKTFWGQEAQLSAPYRIRVKAALDPGAVPGPRQGFTQPLSIMAESKKL